MMIVLSCLASNLLNVPTRTELRRSRQLTHRPREVKGWCACIKLTIHYSLINLHRSELYLMTRSGFHIRVHTVATPQIPYHKCSQILLIFLAIRTPLRNPLESAKWSWFCAFVFSMKVRPQHPIAHRVRLWWLLVWNPGVDQILKSVWSVHGAIPGWVDAHNSPAQELLSDFSVCPFKICRFFGTQKMSKKNPKKCP